MKFPRIPTFLCFEINQYNEHSPLKKFSERFKGVKSYQNLKRYNSNLRFREWILVKCVYCRKPMAFAKKTHHGAVPFYKYNVKIGCDCNWDRFKTIEFD